jgi:hypothetical protein
MRRVAQPECRPCSRLTLSRLSLDFRNPGQRQGARRARGGPLPSPRWRRPAHRSPYAQPFRTNRATERRPLRGCRFGDLYRPGNWMSTTIIRITAGSKEG